ncbi:MAG: hypothetical protein KJ052_16240 [Candidatus Hydrogenedentes bacterium]|nr:hypothetical protein [Candidatus Hydrogenedentota bacterium]
MNKAARSLANNGLASQKVARTCNTGKRPERVRGENVTICIDRRILLEADKDRFLTSSVVMWPSLMMWSRTLFARFAVTA